MLQRLSVADRRGPRGVRWPAAIHILPQVKPRSPVVTAYFVSIALLLVWAVWLLATDDPDGGRHPAGAVMLLLALLLAAAALVSARRTNRR
jgi:hypothetical protein